MYYYLTIYDEQFWLDSVESINELHCDWSQLYNDGIGVLEVIAPASTPYN